MVFLNITFKDAFYTHLTFDLTFTSAFLSKYIIFLHYHKENKYSLKSKEYPESELPGGDLHSQSVSCYHHHH